MSDISPSPAGWPCVLHRPPAGRRVLFTQQPGPAGQVCPCSSNHLLPPQPRPRGAGCHCRALGEWVWCLGQPAVHGRGSPRHRPTPHPVAHLLQPVAGLPPDGRAGKGGGAGQRGVGAPGRHHLQLHEGLPEGEAVPGPPRRPDHLHRKRDGRRDLLYIRREVQLYAAGDPVLCHGWVGACSVTETDCVSCICVCISVCVWIFKGLIGVWHSQTVDWGRD